MALFFDAAWFDRRLAERGLSRCALAAVARMSEADLTLVFKDQRELALAEVVAFAELLGVTPAEIARQAGISTPKPREEPPREDPMEQRLAQIERRLARIEARLAGTPEV